jgi:hypothetical protein
MREDLLAIGLPPEKLVVTGSPAFDALLAAPLAARRPTSDVVLFLSQPIAQMCGTDESNPKFLGFTEFTTMQAIAPHIANAGLALEIRPHPRESRAALEACARSLPGRVSFSQATRLEQAIAGARLVIGMNTMALVEAALRGAPTLSVQIDRRGPDMCPSNRVGLSMAVTETAALGRDLAQALAQPLSASDRRERAARMGWTTGATGRVIALVDGVVS